MKSQDIEDLCSAAMGGEEEKARALLRSGAPVDSVNSWGRTPLMGAATYGHLSIIDILFEHGADPNIRDQGDKKGRRLLEELEGLGLQKAVLNANLGRTALIEAIESRMISEEERLLVVRKLLAADADPKIPDIRGKAPLHHAAWEGQPEVARLLLEAGASPDARDVFGYTALMYARIPLSTGRREEVFRLLQEAGADESGLANVDLVWAARNLDRETLMSALERGADVNFVDSLADTALRRATISFSEAPERAREIVEILLGQGADPNFCPIGKPAIFDVIEGGNVELAKIFVNHGADPSIEWYGESAFKYAMMRRQNEIVELFRSMGAVEGPVKHRGLVVRDGNFAAVLLNRGVEEVAAALAGEGEVFQGIQGKPVDCGAKALLVYQLQGHGWTVVEPAAGFSVNLRRAEDLSRTLACQAIHLGVSDTAGIVEYTLFESGERMEWLYWGPKRAATFLETFASGEWEWDFGSLKKKRKPSRKTDPQEVLHRFLKSQDAYYMGPASRGDGGTQTFFAGWSSRELVRADVVRLR